MTAPTYFGEIGVLARIPRTATVTALHRMPLRGDRRRHAARRADGVTAVLSLMEQARGRLAVTYPSRLAELALAARAESAQAPASP